MDFELHGLATVLSELRGLVAAAPADTLARRLARTSLTVGELFLEWSQRDAQDLNHALADVTTLLEGMPRSKAASYGGWPEWHAALPQRMASDATFAVRAATRCALAAGFGGGGGSGRGEGGGGRRGGGGGPSWSLLGARMGSDGYWRSATSGRVVFGHSYSKLVNLFNGSELILRDVSELDASGRPTGAVADAAIDELARSPAAARLRQVAHGLGINGATCHLSPDRQLLPDATINASSGPIQKCLALLRLSRRHPELGGLRLSVLLTNSLPGARVCMRPRSHTPRHPTSHTHILTRRVPWCSLDACMLAQIGRWRAIRICRRAPSAVRGASMPSERRPSISTRCRTTSITRRRCPPCEAHWPALPTSLAATRRSSPGCLATR
jgi:hypothetical protein